MYRQSEKLLNNNVSPAFPYNMVNFGPLADEIVSLVWGNPANVNGFRVLAAILHGTLAVGVNQTVALNRGRHLYSTERPSRWALATFLVSSIFLCGGPAYQMRTLYFCPVISIFLSSIFFSSPNLSGRRLDVYHTLTHGVALVRI